MCDKKYNSGNYIFQREDKHTIVKLIHNKAWPNRQINNTWD
jgi:hypothetical protein